MPTEKQTVTTETSKKFSINLPDFLRSSLTALFTAAAAVLLQFIDAWITAMSNNVAYTFDFKSLLVALKVAIAAWVGDLIRRYLKSSATVIRVKPGLPEVKTNDDGAGGDGGGVIPGQKPPVP